MKSAQTALQALLDVAGVKSIITFVPKVLSDPKFAGRQVLLELVLASLDKQEPLEKPTKESKADMAEMVVVIIDCLSDKSAAVRELAAKVTEHVILAVGFAAVKAGA